MDDLRQVMEKIRRLERRVTELERGESALAWTTKTPIGATTQWLTNTPPTGWLLCYGQAVSRTTYAALFAVIGTTFGTGDGSTTFNLPDFRGRVPLGQDNMGGSSANRVTAAAADTIGGAGGEENHTLTTDEMPAHNHQYVDRSNTLRTDVDYHTSAGAGNGIAAGSGGTIVNRSPFIRNSGGGQGHNNLQPYLTVNYIIFAGV